MVGAGRSDRATLPEGGQGPVSVSTGNDAADSLHAAEVFAERSGHGRGAVRHGLNAWVRGFVAALDKCSGRDDDPELSAPAGEKRAGGRDPAGREPMAFGAEPAVRQGTIVDATLIDAPSSTKNKAGARDPEMHQTKKGNQWFFGMKAHIGVDVHSGLVHMVAGTAANVGDVSQAHALPHGQEEMVLCDAGYRGVQKRPKNVDRQVSWHVAMRRGERRALKGRLGRMKERMEKTKASLRARVEHPFRVIKRQFGYEKVRYRGLAKNTAQLTTLFALSNLWMVRKELMKMTPEVRP